jgi:polyribonucleotide nucleotidyltransferase
LIFIGAAEFLPEAVMLEALRIGHAAVGVICDAIVEFQGIAGKSKKMDTLRKLPLSLVDAMDSVSLGTHGVISKYIKGYA